VSGATDRAHYRRAGLASDILAALAHDPAGEPLATKRLAALDQFHVGGAAATRRLADRAALVAGERVLDLGSGLGGPARLLAEAYGARVTGLDFSADFCEAAMHLNALTGLGDRVAIVCGDARRLPFADGSFDVVWTEHVAMNISDRAGLYGECMRVLRPGGRLALYDIVRMEGSTSADLKYPVPWARAAATSHLMSAVELFAELHAVGLRECERFDETGDARSWLQHVTQPQPNAAPLPKATLRLVMGPDFPAMIANLRDNFIAGRVGAVQAIYEKPRAA
jgi:ubiquinone/menaquinone biosynthesis C-methylase UbiE